MGHRRILVAIGVLCMVAWLGCKSDKDDSETDGTVKKDGAAATDGTAGTDGYTPGTDGYTPSGDGPVGTTDSGNTTHDQGTNPGHDSGTVKHDGSTTSTAPGTVCTLSAPTCPAGQVCGILAPGATKGTCLRDLGASCPWNDTRCAVAGKNYSVMCGPYNYTSPSLTVSTHVCFLLCEFNGQPHDCPTGHKCQMVNTYNTCVPN